MQAERWYFVFRLESHDGTSPNAFGLTSLHETRSYAAGITALGGDEGDQT